jgi:hypothetical protein
MFGLVFVCSASPRRTAQYVSAPVQTTATAARALAGSRSRCGKQDAHIVGGEVRLHGDDHLCEDLVVKEVLAERTQPRRLEQP